MLQLSYDNVNRPYVKFNENGYIVTNVFIFAPSLHLFENNTVDAEILIYHSPVNGGSNLIVAVPIYLSSNSNSGTILLEEIITGVAKNAPSSGEGTTLSISDYSMENIVPKKPFFSYNGQDVNGDYSYWVVYGKSEGIPLSQSYLSSLQSIIKPFSKDLTGENIFFNPDGPHQEKKKNDIYIDCKPTGNSKNEIDVTNSNNGSSSTINIPAIQLGELFENPIFIYILKLSLICIIFLVCFYFINYGIESIRVSSKIGSKS
jgi:hypothetical protein